MKCAVNKCCSSPYQKHLWSKQYRRATYHIRYWQTLRQISRQLRNIADTTVFYKLQAEYMPETDHSSISKGECQREIRKCIVLTKEEHIHQKGLIAMRCNTLAESKVLKKHPYLVDKYDLSSKLLREDLIECEIQQIEDKKSLFPSFNLTSKARSILPALYILHWRE
jgi:hypothetical protein